MPRILQWARSASARCPGSRSITINAAAGTITAANTSLAFTGRPSGKVMEVKGGSTADHATVDPFTSNGGNHQC
jgi:hypothetical protein